MSGFKLKTDPITLAKVDGDCQVVILPGHIEEGATVPCPDGDHDHQVLDSLHTEVVTNIKIIS
jgi:hypothetical protein